MLDAGLDLTEAFVANAAFTAGMVLFEVPTGVVADAAGRRVSFILGAVTLLITTLAYLALWWVEADVWWWILVSALIGLGFTFYVLRIVMLAAVIVVASVRMHDIGYTPIGGQTIGEELRTIVGASIQHGFGNPPIRMFLLAAPFSLGIGIWVFYAFQPYLLELFGDETAVYLSGMAAAVFALAQMAGGALVGVRRRIKSRTMVIALGISVGGLAVIGVGLAELAPMSVGFWVAVVLLTLVAVTWALCGPIQQALMNQCIPSEQRATVLSFSSLMGSAGGLSPSLRSAGWPIFTHAGRRLRRRRRGVSRRPAVRPGGATDAPAGRLMSTPESNRFRRTARRDLPSRNHRLDRWMPT